MKVLLYPPLAASLLVIGPCVESETPPPPPPTVDVVIEKETAYAEADGELHTGLFCHKSDLDEAVSAKEGFISFDGEYLVLRAPAEAIEITNVVFRPDTEDPATWWLEIHFQPLLDPQGQAYFILDGEEVTGWTLRSSEILTSGSKWALGFTDLALGREMLERIREGMALAPDQVRDATSEAS